MEPFKNNVGAALIDTLSDRFGGLPGFVADANAGLTEMELKARVNHVARCLRTHLDPDYAVALARIVEGCEGLGGWAAWPLCSFVELFGGEHLELSFEAMRILTVQASCEFAVRPFLIAQPARSLAILRSWTADSDPAVRRLVSEGTRPRLPWGERLSAFQEDPTPVLELLELLRHDPAKTVRLSVANHLNDISKDHPARTVEVARRWWSEDEPELRWIVRHALRTLIKAGDPGALEVLGFGPPNVQLVRMDVSPSRIELGGSITIGIELQCAEDQGLVVDYAVHHVKANGKTTPKVFKWSTRQVRAGQRVKVERKHALRPISTRRYYAGVHAVELLINGRSYGREEFELVLG